MSGPLITNTSFAMASQMAAMARMAPATTAMPLPMKSLVTVVLDMVRSSFRTSGVAGSVRWIGVGGRGQTVITTVPRAWPAATWPIAAGASVNG